MKTINTAITSHRNGGHDTSITKKTTDTAARLSEIVWLIITFLLFVAMGPFSVIAVMYGLWSLSSKENREKMVEPAAC